MVGLQDNTDPKQELRLLKLCLGMTNELGKN